ncbi:Penicillin amidase [Operophtera brumata]|uniref:Penicillin amidase n=1 Tax=Operophtera brumata TaxID=104452 RepID=A0A0L7K488_OPEBR|nr:Penicillin amidase [Operophtera brumata]
MPGCCTEKIAQIRRSRSPQNILNWSNHLILCVTTIWDTYQHLCPKEGANIANKDTQVCVVLSVT